MKDRGERGQEEETLVCDAGLTAFKGEEKSFRLQGHLRTSQPAPWITGRNALGSPPSSDIAWELPVSEGSGGWCSGSQRYCTCRGSVNLNTSSRFYPEGDPMGVPP